MLKKAKKKTARIAQSIREKRSTRTSEKNAKLSKPLTGRMSGYKKSAKDYRVTDKCMGCETCVKLCPMRNIAMVDGTPQFGENCERCMALLSVPQKVHWAPPG
jgi:coenzyme F420-reducing hydrogenase gamma subunit